MARRFALVFKWAARTTMEGAHGANIATSKLPMSRHLPVLEDQRLLVAADLCRAGRFGDSESVVAGKAIEVWRV